MIIGAGGHGRVVAEIASLMDKWDEIVFLDDSKIHTKVNGHSVIGKIEDYKNLKDEFKYAFVALGNNKLRMSLLSKLKSEGYTLPVLIHPFTCISKNTKIDRGTVIVGGVVINANAHIGEGCIINTSSSIDHDCTIESGVHISPGVNLGGTVRIGRNTWICIGSTIINNINIGENVIVAAGASVISDISDNIMVGKVPARLIKELSKPILTS